MVNSTNLKISRRIEMLVKEIWYDNGYHALTYECCGSGSSLSHHIYAKSINDFEAELDEIILFTTDEYVEFFGSDNLDIYFSDYEKIEKQYNILRQSMLKSVCNRAVKFGYKGDIKNLHKNLEMADWYFKLDLHGMIYAEKNDFLHDIEGINSNIRKENGVSFGKFLPRYAW